MVPDRIDRPVYTLPHDRRLELINGDDDVRKTGSPKFFFKQHWKARAAAYVGITLGPLQPRDFSYGVNGFGVENDLAAPAFPLGQHVPIARQIMSAAHVDCIVMS